MTSLVDLLPAAVIAETVTVLGHPVPCRPLTLGEIGVLLWRYPEVRQLLAGGKVQPEAIIAFAPRAVAAAIAAGTGHAGKPAEEEAAERLPLEAQIDLFAAILRLTAPGGVVPLVEKLGKLAGGSLSVPAVGKTKTSSKA